MTPHPDRFILKKGLQRSATKFGPVPPFQRGSASPDRGNREQRATSTTSIAQLPDLAADDFRLTQEPCLHMMSIHVSRRDISFRRGISFCQAAIEESPPFNGFQNEAIPEGIASFNRQRVNQGNGYRETHDPELAYSQLLAKPSCSIARVVDHAFQHLSQMMPMTMPTTTQPAGPS